MDEWKYQPARDLGLSQKERLRSVRRESGLVGVISHHLWFATMRCYLRLFHRLTVHGRENLVSQPPFILAANHASHLDALILATALPAGLRACVFPIAAGDTFFETPVLAMFATGAMNALPMWRKNCGRHALEQLRQRLLEEPCAYILFPEGTRSRSGEMACFKPGLGMIVAGTPVPVVPCHLAGVFEALPPHHKIPRWKLIELRIGKPLVFSVVPNNREGWERIASETERAIRSLMRRSVSMKPAD
ncbi:MAG: 1-acyl-sn-glycerol-3-phosphate acyltransferase [Verrucomicrobia bacterium]|nr:1-acyl-sn-glycerol-3-phosphate acyltransferase [Verrucomicrobiota bacterium]